MNSYLNELSRLLVNQLSPEEYNNVMQYYTEYFADAGIEKQEEVIKELGTPEELAAKIIAENKGRTEEEIPYEEPKAEAKEEPKFEQQMAQESVQEPIQAPAKPRKRLAKGWIALIVVGGILVSLPIIITCIKKVHLHFGLVDIDLVEQEYKVVDEFDSVIIDTDITDVEIIVGEDYAVEYVLGEDYEYHHNGNTLSISDNSFSSIINSALNGSIESYIKIYVPADKIIDIDMDIDIGDIDIKGVIFETINIETDIGDVSIEGDSLEGDIFVGADTGDVSVKGFIACDVEIEADLGEVNITSYYAGSAYNCDIHTDLGKETISDEGGEKIEDKYDISVSADIGDVKITFCNN